MTGRKSIPPCLRAAAVLFLLACPVFAKPQGTATTQPVTRTVGTRPVKVTVTLDRDDVTIPAALTLKYTIDYERGVVVEIPKLDKTLGGFLAREVSRPPPTGDDFHMHQDWTLSLEPVLPGDVQIPSLDFAYSDTRDRADGSKADLHDKVTTPPLPVSVHQVLADIKGPESLWAPSNFRILVYILIAVGTLALAGLVLRWLRRRAATPRMARKAPPVPPHVWALAELDILMSEGLLERGKVQEFYYRINAIVRRYIEMRFNMMAGEQTTEEFIRDLARSPRLVEEHKNVLRRFVSACDPVKYARHQPDKSEIDWVQTTAREFIIQTAHMDPQTQLAATPHGGNGHPHVTVGAPSGRGPLEISQMEERRR